MWRNFIFLAGLVPAVILLGAMGLQRWQDKRAGLRRPVSEKLLRPPGHSLSCQLSDLSFSFTLWMIESFLFSIFAVGVWGFPTEPVPAKIVCQLLCAVAAAICSGVAWRKVQAMRNVGLGLAGEQAMGEHLQPLWAKGFHVFHDIPGDGKWNVDHVVVGPSGVFVIETKTKTKKPGPKGEPDFRATFDGKGIRFPGFVDFKAHEQAKRNANWLSVWLSRATGEQVTAEAVVALPGWFVEQTVPPGNVRVLSGKQVAGFIASGKARLSEKAIQQIAYQLEQRCRDVEF